jgi:hypothetical protein
MKFSRKFVIFFFFSFDKNIFSAMYFLPGPSSERNIMQENGKCYRNNSLLLGCLSDRENFHFGKLTNKHVNMNMVGGNPLV